ncbi:hypothetical protein AAHA48_02455, partial [Dickeya oryzae]|uniref:hypothetical protein n=1 Tax=Dickeya oryzae TaxID=1240404 RepID=UPI003164D193
GGNTRLGFAKNIDDLFVGKTLLHGVVLMLLMKTLLTSSCVNQWGAGQEYFSSKVVWLMFGFLNYH